MKEDNVKFEYETPALDVFEYGDLVIARGASAEEIKDKDKDFGPEDEF